MIKRTAPVLKKTIVGKALPASGSFSSGGGVAAAGHEQSVSLKHSGFRHLSLSHSSPLGQSLLLMQASLHLGAGVGLGVGLGVGVGVGAGVGVGVAPGQMQSSSVGQLAFTHLLSWQAKPVPQSASAIHVPSKQANVAIVNETWQTGSDGVGVGSGVAALGWLTGTFGATGTVAISLSRIEVMTATSPKTKVIKVNNNKNRVRLLLIAPSPMQYIR